MKVFLLQANENPSDFLSSIQKRDLPEQTFSGKSLFTTITYYVFSRLYCKYYRWYDCFHLSFYYFYVIGAIFVISSKFTAFTASLKDFQTFESTALISILIRPQAVKTWPRCSFIISCTACQSCCICFSIWFDNIMSSTSVISKFRISVFYFVSAYRSHLHPLISIFACSIKTATWLAVIQPHIIVWIICRPCPDVCWKYKCQN